MTGAGPEGLADAPGVEAGGQAGGEAERLARPLALLAVALGVAAMLAGALRPGVAPSEPLDRTASVNGAPITVLELETAAAAVTADRSAPRPLTRAELDGLRQRLIDEELLFQYALESGLARHDGDLRKRIVQAAVELIVREVEALAPTDAELEAFLADNPGLVQRDERVLAEHFVVTGGADAAAAARRFLAEGGDFEEAARRFGDPAAAALPRALLNQAKLSDYLGVHAGAVVALEPGDIAGPLGEEGKAHFVLMLGREQAAPLTHAERLAQADAMWRSIERDRRLEAMVERLRAQADIDLARLPEAD